MLNKPIKNHWSFAIESIFNEIKSLLPFIIILFLFKHNIYIIAVILLLTIVVSIFQWQKTIFYIKDNMIVFQCGLLSKSKQEIPFDKISTINIDKNFLDKLFNVCTLKIDSGSAVSEKTDLKIKVKCNLSNKIRQTILSNSTSHNKKEKIDICNKHIISLKEIILYSLTKSKIAWVLGVFFGLLKYLDDIRKILPKFLKFKISNSLNIRSSLNISFYSFIYIMFLITIGYLIITILCCIFEIIKLYNFSIEYSNNNLIIKYGLIKNKEYSIPIKKINALKCKQNLLQQKFNIYTLEAVTIGYGDESNEEAIVYPIVTKQFQKDFLENILPELNFKGTIEKAPKKSLSKFILKRELISLIILIPLYLVINIIPQEFKLSIIFIVLLLNIALGYLHYSNTSIGITNKNIIASFGGIKKITTFIKQKNVQSISRSQNIFQRHTKVCTYKIDIYSNDFGEVIKIKHMDENIYKKLYNNLII
ncbi:PH domain-containing protein [Clostridium botulinum]|nr:PH domain-containing protein [Clostridium botulinum]